MSLLFANLLGELPFPTATERLLNKMSEKLNSYVPTVNRTTQQPNRVKDNAVHCGCCGWTGKGAEAVQHRLVAEYARELELFCPACYSYLCFVALDESTANDETLSPC